MSQARVTQETHENPHHQRLARYYVEERIRTYQPMPWKYLRLSSFGKCLRNIALRLTGWNHGQLDAGFIRHVCERDGYEAYVPMMWGTRCHEHIQQDLVKAGVKVRDMEHEISWTFEVRPKGRKNKFPVKLVGHNDGVLDGVSSHPVCTEHHLFELKTMGDWRYKRFVRCGDGELWHEDNFLAEMLQTQGYMAVAEAMGFVYMPTAEIWCMNRGNGQHAIRYEDKDEVIFENQLTRVAGVLDALDYKKDKSWLPDKKDSPSCTACKLCDFKEICWGPEAQSFRRDQAPLEELP